MWLLADQKTTEVEEEYAYHGCKAVRELVEMVIETYGVEYSVLRDDSSEDDHDCYCYYWLQYPRSRVHSIHFLFHSYYESLGEHKMTLCL